MPKKLKNKARLDKFYHIAKETGYRSRAAFKLIQLNKKYNFLSKANVLIDLCAAPGGWLQVAENYMPINSLKIGVDLDPIKGVPNCKTYVCDITSQQCVQLLKKDIGAGGKADVVLNDGAPNVGTSWVMDAFSQTELVLAAFKLATVFLRKGGIFVTKVFRSNDYNSLMWVLQKFFERVEATKPEASRQQSAEIFVVGLNYLAPDYIDKKFFDSKFVFKETETDIMETYHSREILSLQDILKKKKNKTGYAENVKQHLFQSISLQKFVESENPFAILYDFNRIEVGEKDKELFGLVVPPNEWEELLSDLKVLGKRELQIILKWRSKILSKLNIQKTKELRKTVPSEQSEQQQQQLEEIEEESDSEEELEQEIKEAQQENIKRQKKDEKKKIKSFAQQNSLGSGEGIRQLEDEDQELYEFSKIRNVQKLGYVDLDEIEEAKRQKIEEEKKNRDKFKGKNQQEMEDNIEINYQQKLEKRAKAIEEQRRKKIEKHRKRKGEDVDLDEDQFKCEPLQADKFSNLNELEELEGIQQSLKRRWFEQDIFKDLQDDIAFATARKEQLQKGAGDVQQQQQQQQQLEKTVKKVKESNVISKEKSVEDQNADKKQAKSKKQSKQQQKQQDRVENETKIVKLKSDMEKRREQLKRQKKKQDKKSKEDKDEIEFVRADYQDPDGIVARLALAKKMLRKKKREFIIDSTLSPANQYACDWDDKELNLPEWFVQDERKHWFKTPPITKEEADAEKRRLLQLKTQTPKKVLEAKIRKQKRLQRQMKKGSLQAQQILNTDGLSEVQKMEKAKQLVKRAISKGKKSDKKVIVVRQAGTDKVKQGRNVKLVDNRMKLDKKREKMKIYGKMKKRGTGKKYHNRRKRK